MALITLSFASKQAAIASFCLVCTLILVAKLLRHFLLYRYDRVFVPSSIVAGVMGFIIAVVAVAGDICTLRLWVEPWQDAPNMIMSFVFAAMFFGLDVLSQPITRIWNEVSSEMKVEVTRARFGTDMSYATSH